MRRTFGVGAAVTVAAISVFALARPVDARLEECGARGNDVQVVFDIPAASRIWDYFPELAETPELERDDGPAFVVVFAGAFTSPFGGTVRPGQGSRLPKVYQNVICVVQANGTVNLYADVSRIGFRTP